MFRYKYFSNILVVFLGCNILLFILGTTIIVTILTGLRVKIVCVQVQAGARNVHFSTIYKPSLGLTDLPPHTATGTVCSFPHGKSSSV
jgi:hypothetical protein